MVSMCCLMAGDHHARRSFESYQVAQEVRSLAQRSAASAKEIKGLIEGPRETVTRGSELASRAEESMTDVVQSVKRVAASARTQTRSSYSEPFSRAA